MGAQKDAVKTFSDVQSIRAKEVAEAYKVFQGIQQQMQHMQQKYQELQQYREDYTRQINQMGAEGSALARMRNRIDFIHQLDMALSQLGQQIAQIAKQRGEAEQHWICAKQGEKSVEKLIERTIAEMKSQEEASEQKEIDEFAQQQWYSTGKHASEI